MDNLQIIKNRYIIVKSIGEGGMADVYLGVDAHTNKQVAIKILRGDLNSDPVNLERFKREGAAITTLSHPNIVEVYDVGEDNGKNFIVMEYVKGKTLKQLIKQRGALNQNEVVDIMKQLTSATAHAHMRGVIHRDIKSQNVLIKDDGTVKLSDFGIAITSNEAQLTQTNTVMGSVHYLAPELAKGHRATIQSDIYSLGIVMFEMLTGDVPYHGDSPVQVALRHLHDPLPSIKEQNSEINQAVENVVIRATAKDPTLRYTSADQMLLDLETCLNYDRLREAKLSFENKNEMKTNTKTKKKKKSKGSIFGGIIGVLLATLLCVGGFLLIKVLNEGINTPTKTVQMPDIYNYTVEDATIILNQLGLKVTSIQYSATDDIEKDHVFDATPSTGSSVLVNSSVTLYVSEGKYYSIEDYTGKNYATVKALLEESGFDVKVQYTQSNTATEGTILKQSLTANTKLHPTNDKKSITFTVARSVKFYIPYDIIGMDYQLAKTTLEEYGATVKVVELDAYENYNVETGTYATTPNVVVSVSPDVNTEYTQTSKSYITISYYPSVQTEEPVIE